MGLGGAVSLIPGVSAVGCCVSIGSVCGVDRKYCLDMALLMNLIVMAGLIVMDILALSAEGAGLFSFGILLSYLFAAAAAFLGVWLGVKWMRRLASDQGYALFAYYCWGLALFTFILNLMA
jgi:undecaprenyl pyrophosphate phosphatase UppP